ncbi:MAG TPA: VWA domain-containing protein [Terriglobia bacterium]|nr:VWA domain-containing protein [Terriglobia bacterium]
MPIRRVVQAVTLGSVLFVGLAPGWPASTQESNAPTGAKPGPATGPSIRVDVDLVQIVATVTDRNGHYITDLGPDDFVVEVNGARQSIAHFTRDEETPVSLGILIDTSGSMKERLPAARQAAAAFIRGMRPQDEFFLMTFARGTKLTQDFTTDRKQLERALDRVSEGGLGTHLFGAVENGAKATKKAKNRKRALIVISDGGDVSRTSLEKFQSRLENSEALMYAMEIQNGGGSRLIRLLEPAPAKRSANMHAIADRTGGRWFGVDASRPLNQLRGQFDAAFSVVSTELRGQYSIGFYPTPAVKGGASKIRVRAVNAEYGVRTR